MPLVLSHPPTPIGLVPLEEGVGDYFTSMLENIWQALAFLKEILEAVELAAKIIRFIRSCKGCCRRSGVSAEQGTVETSSMPMAQVMPQEPERQTRVGLDCSKIIKRQ